MSRRSLRKSAFDDGDNGAEVGLEELDQLTYGMLGVADKNRVVAEGRPIKDIYPDLRQPRRAVPSAVRVAAVIDPRNMHTLFKKWQDMAEKECHTAPLRLKDMVEGLVDADADDALLEEMPAIQFPITSALLKVIELARDIRENNLINPVTVIRTGRTFKLNTGERRWLAYHFLEWLYGSEWAHIPSHETTASVWTQASENLSRQDLEGIALARQFALLVMECFPDKNWGQVEYFIEGASDRTYYAQVADGTAWKIPRGMGQKIAGAMGVGETTLRTYRQILNVPDEIWTRADDQSWSTNAVREWILQANKPEKTPPSTVWAHTVSTPAYAQTPDGNTWHEQFQARLAMSKSQVAPAPGSSPVETEEGIGIQLSDVEWRQVKDQMYEAKKAQMQAEPDLPQGHSFAKLDKGGGDTFVPETPDMLARTQEAQVRISSGQIVQWADKLLQIHQIETLVSISESENLKGLVAVMISAMSRQYALCQQILAGLGHDDLIEVEGMFERLNAPIDELAIALKNKIAEMR